MKSIDSSRRGSRYARCLVGASTVPGLRLRPATLSWRLARNPRFHAAVSRISEDCA